MRSMYLMIFFTLAALAAAAPLVDLEESDSQEVDFKSIPLDYPSEELSMENSAKVQRRSLGLLFRTFPDFYPLRSLLSSRSRCRHRQRSGLRYIHNNHHHNRYNHHHSHHHGHNYGNKHGNNLDYDHGSRIMPQTHIVPTTPRAILTTTRATTTINTTPRTTTTVIPTTTTAIPPPTSTTTVQPVQTSSPLDHDPNGELIYDIDLRFRS